MKEAIDSLIYPLLTKYAHIGIVVGIIAGKQTAVFGYGKVNKASPAIPEGETLFEIGSITKVFTALLLANMVEEGLVSLDTPVRALLPMFPNLPEEMTLLRLVTHTSGLPRLPANFFRFAGWKPRNPYANYSPARLYAYLSKYKAPPEPQKPPSYLYSNLGFGVLGQALGQKLGTSYEQAVIDRICAPLGLSDTHFTLTAEQQQRLAAPHTARGKLTLNWDFATMAGAGALRSTARDMLRFLAAHLGQFSTPLQPALDLCLKIQVEKPVPQSQLLGVALGWHVSATGQKPARIYWHNGGTGGYSSFMGFVKEGGRGVVILSNYGLTSEPEIDQLGMAVLKLLSRTTYGKHELEDS
ncbi:class A beta-lactamase-related serine hydrolase [Ktedonosporobacter rubrisoli]|uniref:Class A beta-lactamase-related serine hydrolase n=1 Tax=Ktedonosporobacter rubrisoli TaxID=2509675 RepID=A0A4P6JLP7_KTERU|nr:serine hydrolase domain-containing protein [Ktedonosporobacter rubrisoli]QBD76134.1 class A beta-lactamase-related serine hydrolase [Ktedonosporobacter rubrisoli]